MQLPPGSVGDRRSRVEEWISRLEKTLRELRDRCGLPTCTELAGRVKARQDLEKDRRDHERNC